MIYVIYKQIIDPSTGDTIRAELVECDTSEQNAARFSKLYNLQVPKDLKDKILFSYTAADIF